MSEDFDQIKLMLMNCASLVESVANQYNLRLQKREEEISHIARQHDILLSSMYAYGTWWSCPKCARYNLKGYICFNCSFDPSTVEET